MEVPRRAREDWGVGIAVAAVAAVALGAGVGPAPALRDAGEIGAAAQTLGVAHPTGFPLDLLLLRAATFLPFGSLAFRQNLAVAFVSALALGLLATLTFRIGRRVDLGPGAASVAGIIAAVGLGTWATFLGTSVSVEVYSTALLCVFAGALAVEGRRGAVLGVCGGWALGAHVSAWLLLGVLGLAWIAHRGVRRAGSLGAGLVAAPVIAAIPIASWRQPALDWGDPETLGRLYEHLSAGRIRTAYADRMGGLDEGAAVFGGQLAELWPLLVPLLIGAFLVGRRARGTLFAILAVLAADLVYGAFVNPMGAVDRQVGHAAGAAIALLAGLGVGAAVQSTRSRAGEWTAVSFAAVLSVVLVARVEPPDGGDAGFDEVVGAGGPLTTLPPHATFVCTGDDTCAGALFARYAEAVRPDIAVVVAQHLWEPRDRARLRHPPEGVVRLEGRPSRGPSRAALAASALEALTGPGPVPVFFETAAESDLVLVPSRVPPYLVAAGSPFVAPPDVDPARELDHLRRARLGPSEGSVALRRRWSSAYGEMGRAALATEDPYLATRCFRRAVRLAPLRGVAWSNLGVALSAAGDVLGAIDATAQAVRVEPSRTTAWVNLARYRAALYGAEAALEVIDAATDAGVVDPRLDALYDELGLDEWEDAVRTSNAFEAVEQPDADASVGDGGATSDTATPDLRSTDTTGAISSEMTPRDTTSGSATSRGATSGSATSSEAVPSEAMSSEAVPSEAMSSEAMSSEAMSSEAMSSDTTPADVRSAGSASDRASASMVE